MAYYNNKSMIKQTNHSIFGKILNPGEPAPCAGIYKCIYCGKEISCAHNHRLPPENDHEHDKSISIKWKLIVAANTLI